MSKSKAEQIIFITGASGFLGAHVLNTFLSAGYRVRAAVRSEATAEKVRKTHGKFADQLEYAIVADIQKPGAFDEAVKGVDGVIHVASPFAMSVEDNERDLLIPAVRGTLEVLESVTKHAPQVKRVVITSSMAAILDLSKGLRPDYTYSEKDWNPISYEEAKVSNGVIAYCASKAFAERAAWDYVKENSVNFTLSTVCPPFIYGPIAHDAKIDTLGESAADIYRLINGSTKEVPPTGFAAFVDVRDCAEIHLRAYENPAGHRYFAPDSNYTYQQVVDVIRAEFPDLKSKTPEGSPGVLTEQTYKVDNSFVKEALGIEFRGLKKTIVDTVDALLKLEKETGKA